MFSNYHFPKTHNPHSLVCGVICPTNTTTPWLASLLGRSCWLSLQTLSCNSSSSDLSAYSPFALTIIISSTRTTLQWSFEFFFVISLNVLLERSDNWLTNLPKCVSRFLMKASIFVWLAINTYIIWLSVSFNFFLLSCCGGACE